MNSRRLAGVIRSRRTDRTFLLSAVCCLLLLLLLYCPRNSYSFVVNIMKHHPTTTTRRHFHLFSTTSSSSSSSSNETAVAANKHTIRDTGVFRNFADYAIQRLNETQWLQPLQEMPSDLQFKVGAPLPSSLYKQSKTSHINIHNSTITSATTTTTSTSTVPLLDYRVHITVTALEAIDVKSSPIQYARVILMETLPFNSTITSTKPPSTTSGIPPYQHHGLHALNIVVFPNNATTLPIWGISMATTVPQTSKLPTMMTIDAQPMSIQEQKDNENHDYTAYFKDWYYRHVYQNPNLPWGGPLRSTVQPYMSDYLLWSKISLPSSKTKKQSNVNSTTTIIDESSTTRPIMIQSPNQTTVIEQNDTATISTTKTRRIQNDTTISSVEERQLQKTPLEIIQSDVWDAYQEHLDIYLNMVQTEFTKKINVDYDSSSNAKKNQQVEYCDYWRYNEPERTTLQTLFGKEWTERLLWQIMFPFTNTKINNNSTTKTTR